MQRSARVWRLTARRGAHYAVVKVRGARKDAEARAALEQRFAIRTAEDVARELGNMKGAIMKAGQLISFIAEGLPPEAQAALATLQADVPPMAPSLAEGVIRERARRRAVALLPRLEPDPRCRGLGRAGAQGRPARRPDGRREGAVPGHRPGDPIRPRQRGDAVLTVLVARAQGPRREGTGRRAASAHVRRARLPHRSREPRRVLAPLHRASVHPHPRGRPRAVDSARPCDRWIDGWTWAEFEGRADHAARQRAAEVLFRFAQGSVHRVGVFNGDPHPGNYRFHADGTITSSTSVW